MYQARREAGRLFGRCEHASLKVRPRTAPGPLLSKAPSTLGKVEVIHPEINKETRTARIRVELSNPDLVLLHDMYVDAQIDTGSGEPVLSVPDSAVMDTGSTQAVFVDKGEGRFQPRRLRWRSAESIDKMRRSLGSFIKSVCNTRPSRSSNGNGSK